jgi:CBS domain-containing protein
MQSAKVKALVVIDHDEAILGLVSLKDTQGIKTGLAAQEKGVSPAQVTVGMVMTLAEQLETIQFKDLSNARVGHIAHILHEHDLQHLLVVDLDEIGTAKVRGIFSATRISRQLGENISGTLSSQSVGEMHKRIT